MEKKLINIPSSHGYVFPSYTLELVFTAGSPQKKMEVFYGSKIMKVWFFDDFAVQFLVDFSVVSSRWWWICREGFTSRCCKPVPVFNDPRRFFQSAFRRVATWRRWCVRHKKQVVSCIFIFSPIWGNDPIWPNFFSGGLEKNHQLDVSSEIGFTLWKTKMEPGNASERKRKNIYTPPILGFHVNFWGCTLPETNSKFTPERWWQREIILSGAISA